ncbi:YceH family protein [Candidatus Desantisbacteria bacterium]|nr:YceH family protein [Candidatus Desantisbacteria bacterium]
MDFVLTPVEIRIIGCLIEKEITTHEYYPLTLNALTLACNQKSNRNPMMELNEETVFNSIDDLRFKKFVVQTFVSGARVPKFKHTIQSVYHFSAQQLSVLCELFIRGPQTIGELRVHAARLYNFTSLEEVENTLKNLMELQGGPYVVKLPKIQGTKENRYAHLFCGEINLSEIQIKTIDSKTQANDDKLNNLEQEISILKSEIENIKQKLGDLLK